MTEARSASEIPEDAAPDLLLSVWRERREGDICLTYQLREATAETRDYEQKLDRDPFEIFQELFEQVETIGTGQGLDEDARRKAERQLEGIGATLAERILPKPLRRRVLTHHDPACDPEDDAPTLWIVSDEPWVPWELLFLKQPGARDSVFLGEAFALTRWLWDLAPTLALPLDHIGLVVPENSGLEAAAQERLAVLALEQEGKRRVERLEARYNRLLDGFGAKRFTGWHFTGHGWAEDDNPDLWSLVLDDDELKPTDLKASDSDLSGQSPLVFLNACRSARMHLALSGLGGLAGAFLEAGAGAFIGTHWSVPDDRAQAFAEAFYEFFLGGDSIAEAIRQARLWLRTEFEGDPTWLAYTGFAHPLATVRRDAPPLPAMRWPGQYLEIPWREWHPDFSPGALLRADHGVVPFHRRRDELEELREWCEHERPVSVRLLTGAGGMGKTRLALQICQEERDGGWRSGFVKREADARPEAAARSLISDGGPTLVVIDYAETRRDLLVPLFRKLLDAEESGPFRIILLSRRREDWWKHLKAAPGRVGELISGSATSHRALGPLATKTEHRIESYRTAAESFAAKLEKDIPSSLPEDIDAEYFKPVLMLHMTALGAVEGVHLKSEDGILNWVLDRERKFWQNQAAARSLDENLVDGIGRAMATFTMGGGSVNENTAIDLLGRLKDFSGVPRPTLRSVARLLHDTYPGESWIDPVQPDILGEHLIERELEDGRQEIFELVFGPQTDPEPGESSGD